MSNNLKAKMVAVSTKVDIFYKKNSTLINRLIDEMGGLTIFNGLLTNTFRILSKYNKYPKLTKVLEYVSDAMPVYLTINRMVNIVKFHKQSAEKATTMYDVLNNKLRELLNVSISDGIDNTYFDIGPEILKWILSSPKTESFKIYGVYNTKFELLPEVEIENGINDLYVSLGMGELKFLYSCKIKCDNYTINIISSSLHIKTDIDDEVELLKEKVLGEYIKQLSIADHVIKYNPSGIGLRKKENNDLIIKQIDIDALYQEMQNSMDLNKKRAYVLCGPPGTGKTSIVQKIEAHFNEVPIISVAPNIITDPEDVYQFFNFVKTIKPCIVLFEDMDANPCMVEKNDSTLGAFLESIDSNHEDNKGVIIIATVNDTSLIHSTLINRRGRFDKVLFIDAPKTKEEVLEILQYKIKKTGRLCFEKINALNKFYKEILNNKLTHSDICEIIDNLVVQSKDFTKENLFASLKELLNTKESIRRCYKLTDSNSEE